MRLLEKSVRDFKYGTIDELEAQSIPDGAASASLNWQTKGDKIELRRGSKILGTAAYQQGSELITNGSFTGNANSWTLNGGWAYGTNKVTFTP